jgi:hypothetical protein
LLYFSEASTASIPSEYNSIIEPSYRAFTSHR